jgi:hypothetical protein
LVSFPYTIRFYLLDKSLRWKEEECRVRKSVRGEEEVQSRWRERRKKEENRGRKGYVRRGKRK